MENQAFTHFQSLIEALGAAITRCVVWRYADNKEKYNALQLYRFAEEFDRENPIKDGSFYLVSAEGAIGVSPGAEYLTRWMFIPSMDEASVEKLKAEIRQLQEPASLPKFCPNCGAPYKSDDSKFCPNCGTPLKA